MVSRKCVCVLCGQQRVLELLGCICYHSNKNPFHAKTHPFYIVNYKILLFHAISTLLVGWFFFFFFFWLLLSLGCNTISTLSLFILLFYFHSQTLLSIFAFNHFENWSTFLLSSTIIQTCIHTDIYTPKTSRVYAMLQFVLIFWLMIFTTANYMFHFAFFFFCFFNWLHQTTESIPFASNIYIIIIMSGSFRASWTEPWKTTSGWNNGNMYNCKISVWNEWTECRGKVNTKSWPQKKMLQATSLSTVYRDNITTK